MSIFDLSGKVAIVTGGNRGIGFGIARGLAQSGAQVVISNRHEAEGKKAADVLKKEGLKAVAIPVDISKVSSHCRACCKGGKGLRQAGHHGQ